MLIADCVTPAQAIEMTTESQYPETAAVFADWVVADAVPPNRSPQVKFPANSENNRHFFNFRPFSRNLTSNTDAISGSCEKIP